MKNSNNLYFMLNRLILLFTAVGVKPDKPLAIKIVKAFIRWRTCEGHHGIKRAKAMNLGFIRALMGVEYTLPVSAKYKRMVKHALILSGNSVLDAVFWTSVFSFHRLLTGKVVIDTGTITRPFTGSLFRLLLKYQQLTEACESLRIVGKHSSRWSADWKWHISGKSGPNGPLAYTLYREDLRAIRRDGLYFKNLFLMHTLPLNNWDEAVNFVNRAYGKSNFDKTIRKDCIHSRIVGLSDKAGKTRVVAMVDILSQSNLAIVHRRLSKFLRSLRTDGTFDQDKQRRRVREWTKNKEFVASIDLSAATDRLPVLYQAFVIYRLGLLTFTQTLAWWLVVVRRPFQIGRTGSTVRYSVGQPMGALSSWPAMAVSHHALVWWSYKVAYPDSKRPKNHRESFTDYALLGDDLVISDKYVAEAYLELISHLGVDVSLDKSFISYSKAEFAKSLFRKGDDLSPFPVAEFDFTNKTIMNNTLSIMSWLEERNLKLTLQRLTGLFPAGKWRRMASLTALSPVRPNALLDTRPLDDYDVFYSLLWQKRVHYFSRRKTVQNSVYYFWQKNPAIDQSRLASPFSQLGADNGTSYPTQGYRDARDVTYAVLGSEFVAYCSLANPGGIAPLGPRLVPLPTWEEGKDDELLRSSLLSTERRFPGYFTKRCSGRAVGK